MTLTELCKEIIENSGKGVVNVNLLNLRNDGRLARACLKMKEALELMVRSNAQTVEAYKSEARATLAEVEKMMEEK